MISLDIIKLELSLHCEFRNLYTQLLELLIHLVTFTLDRPVNWISIMINIYYIII